MSSPKHTPNHASHDVSILAALRNDMYHVALADYAAGFRQTWHAHDECILTLIVAGQAREAVGREDAAVGPLQIGIKPSGVRHTDHFGPVALRALRIAFTESSTALASGRQVLAQWGWSSSPAAARSLFRAADKLARSGAMAKLDDDILDAVACLSSPGAPMPIGRPPRWLANARQRLADEHGQPSLASLARAEGVHPVYFAAQFRRFFGSSVGSVRQSLKAQRAVALLVDARDSLAVVACQAGYADQAHFTRRFGRELGIPPSRFRALVHGPLPSDRSRRVAPV